MIIIIIIISAATIILLLFILGISIESMMWLLLIILGVMLSAMGIFFIYCTTKLITGKKTTGTFIHFDKHSKYDKAVYTAGEDNSKEEYTNLFPAEKINREKIYTSKPENLTLLRPYTKKKSLTDTARLLS